MPKFLGIYVQFFPLKITSKSLGRARLRKKKYHFHLGHHNENSFAGKPKDLAFHV